MWYRGQQRNEMKRTQFLLAVAVGLAMLVAVPAIGAAAASDTAMQVNETNETQADEVNETQAAETNETQTDETTGTQVNETNVTAPGERLTGVVGVQQAELQGDVDQRTFGVRVAQSASNGTQADVVASQLDDVEQRLVELRERKAELDEQRAAGEISEGRYRAEVAQTAAQIRTAERLTNQSAQVAGQLPTALLDERGVNAERIEQLRANASELTGPEVAEIARGIAGQNAGQRPADAPGGPGAGPADNETDDRRGGPQDERPGDTDRQQDTDTDQQRDDTHDEPHDPERDRQSDGSGAGSGSGQQ